MRNIFIAGSSKQRQVIHVLIHELKAQGYESFDWTQHPGFTTGDYLPEDVANEDLNAVKECDGLVWAIGESSSGAPFEAGYAMATGKPVVVLWLIPPSGPVAKHTVYAHVFEQTTSLADAVRKIEDRLGAAI